MKKISIITVVCATFLLGTGCKSIGGFLFDEVVTQEAQVVTVDQVVEYAPGQFQTNALLSTNWVAVTNQVVRPMVAGGIKTAGSLGGPAGSLAAAIVVALLGGAAGWKNRNRTAGNEIQAVVQSVEAGKDVLRQELEDFNKNGDTHLDAGSLEAKMHKAMKKTVKYAGYASQVGKVVTTVRKALGK